MLQHNRRDYRCDMPLVFRIEALSSKFLPLGTQSVSIKCLVAHRKRSLVAAEGRARLKHNLLLLEFPFGLSE